MRIWCCLPCFVGDDREDTMRSEKDSETQNLKEEVKEEEEEQKEEQQEEELSSSEGLELGFCLGLPGSSSGNSGSSKRSVEGLKGGSKRDLGGFLVEREKSLIESLKLSIGGSSSHPLPFLDYSSLTRNVIDAGESSFSLLKDNFISDLQHKRAKLESIFQ